MSLVVYELKLRNYSEYTLKYHLNHVKNLHIKSNSSFQINLSNQTVGSVNLLTNNIMGFSPLINPIVWNQNQCLPQFCGHPLVFGQPSCK